MGLDFPITVNTEVMIPDQAAMIKQYKGRLKKMQAAQRDSHGNVPHRCRCAGGPAPVDRDTREPDLKLAQNVSHEYGDRCPHLAAGAEPP